MIHFHLVAKYSSGNINDEILPSWESNSRRRIQGQAEFSLCILKILFSIFLSILSRYKCLGFRNSNYTVIQQQEKNGQDISVLFFQYSFVSCFSVKSQMHFQNTHHAYILFFWHFIITISLIINCLCYYYMTPSLSDES